MAKYRFAALLVILGSVAALLLGTPGAALADIAIQDAATSWSLTNSQGANDAAFSETELYTVTAGASVLIVDYGAFVQTDPADEGVTITWNGQALTGTTLQTAGSTNVSDEIFYLWNPTAASNGSLVITGINRGAAFGAYTLSGVDTTVAPTVVGASGNDTTIGVTLPTTTAGEFAAIAEDCRFSNLAGYTTTSSGIPAPVQQFTANDTGNYILVGGAYVSGLAAGAGPTITAANAGDTNGTPRRDISVALFSPLATVGAGPLQMARGTSMNLDVATVYTGTTFTGPVGGAATIDTTQAGMTSNLGLVDDGGVATILVKDGPGNLLANTPGNQFAATSTIRVKQGSLTLVSSNVASGAGAASIELAGGTLILQGTTAIASMAGVAANWYAGDPAGSWDNNLAAANTLNSYTPTKTTVEAQLAYPNCSVFTTNTGNITSTAQFTGFIHVTAGGTYSFATDSDDGSVMWLDTGSGLTEIVGNRGGHGMTTVTSSTLTLAAGDYPFVTSWYNSGGDGGLYLEWNYNNSGLQTIPAANLLHDDVAYQTSDMTANNIHVTATGSAIDLDAAYYLKLGNLSLDAGMTLNVLPSQPNGIVRFLSTAPAGDATFNVTGTMYAGAYTQAAAGSRITMTGSGYLLFDKAGNSDGLTSLDLRSGWVGLLGDGGAPGSGGASTYMPNATLSINGGGLVVSGTTPGNTVLLNNPINVLGNGSIEARAVGELASAGNSAAYILVQRDQPLTLGPAGSNLTLTASGFYNMLLAGEVKGAGNLIKTGDSTVTLNNATYSGTTTVQAGTLVIASALLPTETSGITVSGGALQLSNTANLGSHPVTVNAGAMTVAGALTAGNIAVNGGSLTGNSTVAGGPVTVGAGGTFLSQGVATLSGVNSAGTTNFSTDLTIAGGSIRVTAGTTTANGLVTTPEILVTGGDYAQPNTSLTLGKMTLTGGLTTIANNLQVNSDLSILGGKLVLGGLLTAGGNFTLSDNGILNVTNTNALAGLPAFSVGQGVGHSALLEFAGPQNPLTMPVVTVSAGSAITGDTSGIEIRGDGSTTDNTRLVLEWDAVYGGTAAPTTDDMGYVRVQRAILPGDSGSYVLGYDYNSNTGIYTGAIYGVWSRSNFRDATTVQPLTATLSDIVGAGLMIDLNGEVAPLTSAATLNTPDTYLGADFFGAGRLNVQSAPSGEWAVLTRQGDSTTVNSTILQLSTSAIPDGKTVNVSDGRVWLDYTPGQQIAPTGTLNILDSGALILGNNDGDPWSRPPTQGNVHIGSGGMLFVRDQWNMTAGATYTFDSGALLAFHYANGFDFSTNPQWPVGQGIHFVQDYNGDASHFTNFRMGNGDWFLDRTGDNSYIGGGGTGLLADQSDNEYPGSFVGVAATPGHAFYADDPVDFRVNNDNGSFALDLKLGSPDAMTTIVGNWDTTRWTGQMTGDTWIRNSLYAGNVTVQAGVLYIQPQYGTKTIQTQSISVIGSSSVPYSVLYLDRSDDGTSQSYGHLEVGGPGSWLYLNDYGGGNNVTGPNRVLANALINGTLADEIVVNNLGAFYFRLRQDTPDNYTLPGVGSALKIDEQIRFTGGYAGDAAVFGANGTQGWWDDNRRDLSMSILRWNGNPTNNLYLPNVIIDQADPSVPVVLAIRPDQGVPYIGLTFRSDGTTSKVLLGNSGNWSVVDAVSAPGTGPHTWNIGQATQAPMIHTMYGMLGTGMTANLVNGSLTFAPTASVQAGASFILGAGTTTTFQANVPLNLSNIEYMGGTLNLAAGQSIRAEEATFAIQQDLGAMSLQLTNGVVAFGGKITSNQATATSSWDVQTGGELTLTGHAALDTVSALSLSGGKMTLLQDGSSVVGAGLGASLTVNANSVLNVDRETAAGGSNRWLTFGSLTLNGGVAAVTAGHGYGVAFGDISLTGGLSGSAGITTNGPATFGAVAFIGDPSQSQTLFVSASSAQLGALTGGPNKHVAFGGGDLHLTPGTTWQGDLYLSDPASRLVVDNDLSGYALPGGGTTIQVNGITDVLPGSEGTNMSGIITRQSFCGARPPQRLGWAEPRWATWGFR